MEKHISIFDRRLLISACALIALAWALFVFDQWVTHRNRLTDQGNRAATLALAVEQRIERSLRVADQMLMLVRQEVTRQNAWKDSAKQTRILEYLTPNLDEVFAVAFVSPDGIATALSNPAVKPGRDHGDRDFYQFHLANNRDGVYLEKPFALASTGDGAFTLSRALRDEKGELLGIVLTVIRTDVLAREFEALRIGSNGSIGLHHLPSYSIIARQPMYYETAAQQIGDESLRKALEKGSTGFFTGAVSADNENRFFAFRKLPLLPMVVTVGISHEDIDTDRLRDLQGHFITMLMLTALLAGGAAFLRLTHRREMALKGVLTEKKRLLDAFVDSIPAGIATIDKDMRYRLINPEMAKINGKQLTDYLDRTVSEVHPSLVKKIAPYLHGVLTSGNSYRDIEFSGKRHGDPGHQGYWQATFFPIRNETGDVVMMGCFVVDITEQKHIEEELRRSELLLNTVLDVLPVGIGIANTDGLIVRSNPARNRIWGGKLHVGPERYGEYKAWWAASKTPVGAAEWALARAISTGKDVIGDLIDIEDFGGERKSVINSAVTLRDLHGVCHGAVVVIEDVTEIRKAQDDVRISRDFFESLFNDAPVGMAIADRNGRYIKVNRALARFTGYTEEELLTMSYMDLIHPDESVLNVQLKEQLASGAYASIQTEKRYLRKDGSYVWGLAVASVILDKEGRPTQAIGQVLDIHRLKKAEQALQDSRRRLRALSSHQTQLLEAERKHIAQEIHDELGQLLTALKMEISLLRMSFGDNRQILDKAEQMRLLIDKTIAVVRHIASNLRPAALDLGLLPAIEWLAGDFSARWGISCSFEADCDDLLLGETVATTVFRVAQESLTNIARHAAATIAHIRLHRRSDALHLSITDNGCGFNMAEVNTQKSFGFFGMRERVLAAGGTLNVESTPGKGTTVNMAVPIDKRHYQ